MIQFLALLCNRNGGVPAWRRALVLGIGGLFFGYFAILNQTATSGHTIQELSVEADSLQANVHKLEQELSLLESLQRIQQVAEQQGLVKVGKMEFVTINDIQQVAQK